MDWYGSFDILVDRTYRLPDGLGLAGVIGKHCGRSCVQHLTLARGDVCLDFSASQSAQSCLVAVVDETLVAWRHCPILRLGDCGASGTDVANGTTWSARPANHLCPESPYLYLGIS